MKGVFKLFLLNIITQITLSKCYDYVIIFFQ